MIPVPFRRLYAIPVDVGGRTVMLINAPRCWCGKRMSGREALPTSSPWPDINWICDEHGNEGMAFEYVANDHFATVNAVPVPEPSEGPPKLPADHSLCDLPCDLPAEAHDG